MKGMVTIKLSDLNNLNEQISAYKTAFEKLQKEKKDLIDRDRSSSSVEVRFYGKIWSYEIVTNNECIIAISKESASMKERIEYLRDKLRAADARIDTLTDKLKNRGKWF